MRRSGMIAGGLVGLAVVVGSLGLSTIVRPAVGSGSAGAAGVDPQVAMGAHLFVQFGCSACHGLEGRGGVSRYVPGLKSVGKALTVKQLSSIINHGLGESANPKRPYMPVWGAVISKRQVSDLVTYIRAGLPSVPTATPPEVPRDQGLAVAGAALYVR